MGTITIEQTPNSKNLYLYPTGSSATALTAVGAIENWDCVDDSRSVYDTSTYVYSDATSTVTDVYNLENPSISSGDINSVTFYVRGKSYDYRQSSNGKYGIIFDDGFGNKSYSDNIDISTGYQLYSKTWSSHPTTSNAWSWTDINNMLIGIECSSPSITATFDSIFRPNSAGNSAMCNNVGDTDNYLCVDDVSPDDDSTYNKTVGNEALDLFTIPNHTTEEGTINNLTIYTRGRCSGANCETTKFYTYLRVWGNNHSKPPGGHNLTNNYNVYSDTWDSDPSDSSVFIWDDIDNGIEIGYMAYGSSGKEVRITQNYLVVNYTTNNFNPEIRTTQMYARVNYTPSTTTAYLNFPSSYNLRHSREIKSHNFWNDTRAVYSVQRANKTLSMKGSEWNTSTSEATDRMEDIRTMADEGSAITISGMDDTNLNTTWVINNFSYNQDEKNKNMYNWNLTAEKA